MSQDELPLGTARAAAQRIAAGDGRVRDLAVEIVGCATAGLPPGTVPSSGAGAPDPSVPTEHCRALWLLWSALDSALAVYPEQAAETEAAMWLAASEWLEALESPTGLADYFARWLTELGVTADAVHS